MHTEAKKKIKTGGELILNTIAILTVLLYILKDKTTALQNTLFDWLLHHAFDILIIAVLLLLTLRLWTDNFLTKPWKKKDYIPLIGIIYILILYFIK
ncbi:MAG: hypothetical protein LBD91_06160 [Prevotellaceae bacterium]|nr:hypothetical protein [Prevotellaceae bacterium]